jgi:tubulin beta
VYIHSGQCGNQIGVKFFEGGVVCNEQGINGGGESCGDSDALLNRFNLFYHEASGRKCVPCAMLMDFEPGVIDACRSASSSTRITS